MAIEGIRRRLALFTVALAATVLAGCATSRISPEEMNRIYCEKYKPVSWSINDTDQTIFETKANNAIYKESCK